VFKRKVIEGLLLTSGSAGEEVSVTLGPIPEALQGRSGSVYVLVQNVDSDTRLVVKFDHTPDGSNWASESTAMFDSGTSTGISNGMNAQTTATDITRVDTMRLKVSCQKTSGGSGQKRVMVSIWIVIKPF
jgi:hypothetical protein